jgi:hypothetical protein
MNRSGTKAATSEMLIASRVADLLRALERGAERRHALLEIAEAVLDHDDGVVDHEADRDRERHQREIVDRKARHPHHRAGAGERQRHRHADGDRRRRPPQEHEYHEHDQRDGREQRELHVVHAGADGLGAVREHRDIDAGGDPALDFRQQLVDAVDHLDNVRIGLLFDHQQHRGLTIEPGGPATIAHP